MLREEGSGILRWAWAGFVKLQTEFAETGDFALTDSQRERVDSLLAESDSLRLFVKESLERHEHDNVTSAEISQAYAEFCADKGWNALPTSVVERTLPDLMLEMFHVTKSHSIELAARAAESAVNLSTGGGVRPGQGTMSLDVATRGLAAGLLSLALTGLQNEPL